MLPGKDASKMTPDNKLETGPGMVGIIWICLVAMTRPNFMACEHVRAIE
jgi:hypothetical protein